MPKWLSDLVSDHRYGGLRAIVADEDDPVTAIGNVVAANPGSVVCMATHARGAIGATALGNVAQDVVRNVGVPVLLVGRYCAESPSERGPIVVCHDGSRAADVVLAPARAWAQRLGVGLVLVHVYHPLDVATAENPTSSIGPAVESLGTEVTVEVVASSFPAGAISEMAREFDASLIVMGTHGRTGAARIVMGSVASWVTREATCPVLAIRPPTILS